MNVKRIVRTIIILIVLLCNVGCDQISKRAVRRSVAYNESIGLIGNYLTLTKVENPGAFLSLGHALPKPVKVILLSILPLLVLGYGIILIMMKTDLSKITVLGLCFVIGGGIGNIYDRVVYGSVTDFLHIDFIFFQTGIFNMADVSIMTGVFLVLVRTIGLKKSQLTENITPDH